MFIVDEKAGLIDGSTVTALVALNTLKSYPGAKILYNLICSRSVPELILQSRRRADTVEGRPLDHQSRDARSKTSSSEASTADIFTFATTGTPIRE